MKMFQRHKKNTVLLTTVLMFAAMPVLSGNTDSNHVHPGTACKQFDGGTGKVRYYYGGEIRNTSTAKVLISCPIIRESQYGGWSGARVNMNKASTGNVQCWFDSRTEQGNTGRFYAFTVSGSGYQSGGDGYYNKIMTYELGSLNLTCDLGLNDRILNYVETYEFIPSLPN